MKKLRSFLSVALALVMALSLFTTMALFRPAVQADAAEKAVPLSATRYRYPIIRMENAKFRNGVAIDDNNATNAYLLTGKKSNGKDPMDTVYAHVEDYDMFNMKLGKNKALYVTNRANTAFAADSDYMGYKHRFGSAVDTREDILPASIQGIPTDAADHGILFHVEVKGLPDRLEDGFVHLRWDDKGNENGEPVKHVPCYANVTFQERDFKPDGTPKKKRGELCATAMNVKPGAAITFIWTKQIDWDNPDKGKPQAEWSWDNTEVEREINGKPVLIEKPDGTKEKKIRLIPDRHKKPGDVEVIRMPEYNVEGGADESGAVNFPADFCGYVIIPFSEFHPCWQSDIWSDNDNMLNFKKMELVDFNFSAYPHYRGEIIFDELSFYGPTFAKVNGAYDYGDLTFENHRDSLINRKRITVKHEPTVQEDDEEEEEDTSAGSSEQPGEQVTEQTSGQDTQKPEKKTNLLGLWIALGAVGVAAIIIVVALVVLKKPNKKEQNNNEKADEKEAHSDEQ